MREIAVMEQTKKPLAMHPKKFALWLFIVSIIMIFAALTSAYIVQRSQKNWMEIQFPTIMYISTAVLLLSSISMHWSYLSAKKDNIHSAKVGILITIMLGILFTAGQFLAWNQLAEGGVTLSRFISGDFIYVLTWVHAFHLLTGIIFLLVVFVSALRYNVHSKNMVQIEMCTTYWHFLDGLWLYLFVFLLIYH